VKQICILFVNTIEPLRETVQKLAETFNDPQIRETSYFDFYDDSLVIHGFPPNIPNNKDGFREFIYILWNAFPDIKIIFDDIIIEENKVVCRYVLFGTHKGEFLEMPPTNKTFRVNGMTIFYFKDRKCVQRWNLVDMTTLMEQLNQ
jgi:steroid delta-isomerase-like uncharacterized protein